MRAIIMWPTSAQLDRKLGVELQQVCREVQVITIIKCLVKSIRRELAGFALVPSTIQKIARLPNENWLAWWVCKREGESHMKENNRRTGLISDFKS